MFVCCVLVNPIIQCPKDIYIADSTRYDKSDGLVFVFNFQVSSLHFFSELKGIRNFRSIKRPEPHIVYYTHQLKLILNISVGKGSNF